MNRESTVRSVAPIELPPAPEPDPSADPLATAVVTEVHEGGYEAATVESVVKRARISREEFDRRFESLDACVLDTYERLIADYEKRVGAAFNRHATWPEALRAAAYETADWMTEYPDRVAFGAAEVLAVPDEMVRVRREGVFDFCAEMIDRGREVAADPESIPDSAPTIAIGAIMQLLTHRLQEGAAIDPPAVIPEMMNRIVAIYLGAEVAEAEWTAPRPAAEPRA